MEHILYYNHPKFGYDLYERSDSFPLPKYEGALLAVCKNIADPKSSVGNVISLRYGQLEDRYLMSVIFRQVSGSAEQQRGFNIAVHYLLSPADADEAFAEKPDLMLSSIVKKAKQELQKYNIPVNAEEPLPASAQNSVIPPAQLLNAASYGETASLRKQAYFVTDTPIFNEVAAMLELLPAKLRKHTSFHTGILTTQESIGTAVNFGTHQMMEEPLRSRLTGGQNNTNKYLYFFEPSGCIPKLPDKPGLQNSNALLRIMREPPYPELVRPLLLDRIEAWRDLTDLLSLASGDPLPAALELIPEEELVRFLQSSKPSDGLLLNISVAAQSHNMLRIYEAAEQAYQKRMPKKKRQDDRRDFTEKLPKIGIPVTEQPQGIQEQPQSTQQERPRRMSPVLLRVLLSCGKLVALAALILCGAVLLKGAADISRIPAENTVTLVIDLNAAGMLWRILGLMGVSAAISAILTHQFTKRKLKKAQEAPAKENTPRHSETTGNP